MYRTMTFDHDKRQITRRSVLSSETKGQQEHKWPDLINLKYNHVPHNGLDIMVDWLTDWLTDWPSVLKWLGLGYFLHHEDGNNVILRNFGILRHHYTASQFRRTRYVLKYTIVGTFYPTDRAAYSRVSSFSIQTRLRARWLGFISGQGHW